MKRDTASLVKEAYREIRSLRGQLAEAKRVRGEPIAVIGMGCRFPAGAHDADSLWRILHDGVDAVGPVPVDRWDTEALYDSDPDAPGKLYCRHGSFLDGIDQFDAGLFGISPAEARSTDPQQRLLLEVAWEALENAAVAPSSLGESRTGVFVGLMYQDYFTHIVHEGGLEGIGPHVGTGSAFGAAAGRLSYVFGLQGPSIAIDTACSSSLVSLHLACQSLRAGECELAIAGGVNAMVTPGPTIQLSKARMMSPSGRCRTFDAAADGYVRGEGCGLVVLKRLSRAEADGDRIWGLIRGSAVNQDGRSSGFTAPNGAAQRTLMRAALAAAGVNAEEVGYLECHGTGTPLGDPVEVGAILDVYGDRPADRPLAIGSVKTNFGHLESAAGICGFLKALLALSHCEIPPHLHLERLNPHIRLDGRPVVIPTEPTPWFPADQGPGLAAISAFGFVGTNAHMILQGWSAVPEQAVAEQRAGHLLTLSAATEPALRALCERQARFLAERPALNLADFCFTANIGRSHLEHRVAIVGRDAGEMRAVLEQVAAGAANAQRGVVQVELHPRPAFLFSGQGAQRAGAGRELYQAEPVFREVLDRCDEILRPHLDEPLLSVLFARSGSPEAQLLDQTEITQPALLALEVALFEQWRAWGVRPSVVAGHSVGEYAAACAAGIFSLEDALALLAARGQLMQELPGKGAMAAVFAGEEWGRSAVSSFPDTLSVAAINGPSEVVLSGLESDLRQVLERARNEGLRVKELSVSHAFHSPLMRPMLEPFRRVLDGVEFHSPKIPILSNATGLVAEGGEMSRADYWLSHVLAPVRFGTAVETLAARQDRILLELGPSPILTSLAARTLGEGVTYLTSLRPSRHDVEQMLLAAGSLFVHGVEIDFAALDRSSDRRKLSLPTYPFQHESYWVTRSRASRFQEGPARPRITRSANGLASSANGFLGREVVIAGRPKGVRTWNVDANRDRRGYLWEHQLMGRSIWPISAQVSLALEAAREGMGLEICRIASMEFRETLRSLDGAEQQVQAVLEPYGDTSAVFRVYSRLGEGDWTLNTEARLEPETGIPGSGTTTTAPVVELAPAAFSRTPVASGGDRAPIELSMMFFAALQDIDPSDGYRLVREAAQFGDREGFGAVWVPERHFTEMGSLYPNPSVLHAALATQTERIGLRAGSVVLPLHHPIRIAEEWAMVDNLSGGRIGLSLASGWNPDDFVLAPGRYEDRYRDLYQGIETLRRLWRGEAVETEDVGGRRVQVRTNPRPVQAELPVWVTAARSPQSFAKAGAIGANLLTHLLDQDIEALAEKIVLYRQARAENGLDPETGEVTVMVHTFLASDMDTVHRLARQPFCDYLIASKPLLAGLAQSRGEKVDLDLLSDVEVREFVEFLYERFCGTRALIGTPANCLEMTGALHAAGVTEVACLLDFGPSSDQVLEHLPELARLRVDARAATRSSRPAGEHRRHAYQRVETPLTPHCDAPATGCRSLAEARSRCTRAAEPASFYAALAARGVELEGSLRGIAWLGLGEREALVETRVAAREPKDAIGAPLLDACMQSALAAINGDRPVLEDAHHRLRVPTSLRNLRLHQRPCPGSVWSFGEIVSEAADGSLEARVTVFAEDGTMLFEVDGVQLKTVSAALAEEPDEIAGWAYEPCWREAPWPDAEMVGEAAPARPWLVLDDESGLGEALAALRSQESHLHVRIGPVTEQVGPGQWFLDPGGDGSFDRLLARVDLSEYEAIVFLWPVAGATTGSATAAELTLDRLELEQARGIEAVTALVQALGRVDCRRRPPVWLVTRGTQPVRGAASQVAQSPLWGLAGSLAREVPEWWGGIVDLDPEVESRASAADLARVLSSGDGEDQVAVRGGGRLVRRIVRSSALERVADDEVSFSAADAYLITGGLGGIGQSVARWMAGRGARRLILLGRSSPASDDPRLQAVTGLREQGVDVTVAAVDVADPTQLGAFLARYAAEAGAPRLAGVFHAAGVFRDEALAGLSRERLWEVMRSKVLGAWALHRALPGDLDFFVLFSSFSGLTPPHGQPAYAAASAFLDSLAHLRHSQGLAALSIDWGAWSEIGFAATETGHKAHARLETAGMRRMTPEQGLAVLGRLLAAAPTPQVGVFPMDLRRLADVDPVLARMPVLAELGRREGGPSEAATAFLASLRQRPASEQRELVAAGLAGISAEVLQLPRSRLDVETPLTQLGLDSLLAVHIKNRLQQEMGLFIPLINVLKGASVASLAEELATNLRVDALRPDQEDLTAVAAGPHEELEL